MVPAEIMNTLDRLNFLASSAVNYTPQCVMDTKALVKYCNTIEHLGDAGSREFVMKADKILYDIGAVLVPHLNAKFYAILDTSKEERSDNPETQAALNAYYQMHRELRMRDFELIVRDATHFEGITELHGIVVDYLNEYESRRGAQDA